MELTWLEITINTTGDDLETLAEQIAYNKRLNAANKRRWNTRG